MQESVVHIAMRARAMSALDERNQERFFLMFH